MHGCWHDEGRLFNEREAPGVWGALASSTIPRLPDIAARSGIALHRQPGYLGVAGPRYLEYSSWVATSRAMEGRGLATTCTSSSLPHHLKDILSLPSEAMGCLEACGGHLSPRRVVRAQLVLARRAGSSLLPTLATGLSKARGGWRVTTEQGELWGRRVVLAQGTYTATSSLLAPLLPPLDLTLTAQTIALLEVDGDEAARLAAMPSMVVQVEPSRYTYILPPIPYPDGRTYLKLGAHDLTRQLRTGEDVTLHYRAGPDPAHVTKLAGEARVLLPGLAVTSIRGDSCVTSNTPGKLAPYIDTLDMLGPGLVVAAGGCGHAAKGCDEIGRLAMVLALEERWDSPLPRGLFKVQFREQPHL